MPKSKRQTLISLTKTDKKATKEQKSGLIEEIQEQCGTFNYVWVFSTEHMRNQHLQEVRKRWKPEKIYLGKLAVMRKALGTTPEEEQKPGCAQIASALQGNVGLLFTNSTPAIVIDWFASYTQPDYLRTGNTSPETVIIPAGPVLLDASDPTSVAPHSLEPQLRKLGMPTRLVKGVPTLETEFTIVKQGQQVKPDQVNLLKLFNKLLATFQIKPQQCLNLQTGQLVDAQDVDPEQATTET